MAEFRVGQGVDVHQFVEGRDLILGGVKIPSEKGLLGHSDADALLHAITDAVLGAIGKGDIGTFFPDTDPHYQGADSKKLLQTIWEMVHGDGWQIVNLDTTVICERPKLLPFREPICNSIAGLLGCDSSRVSFKATTCEKLGFLGRGEGIMATCVVLLQQNVAGRE